MKKFCSKIIKKCGNLNVVDMGLTKLSIIALVFLIMNLSPGLVAWMEVQHWALFLVIALVLALKPLKKVLFLFKK